MSEPRWNYNTCSSRLQQGQFYLEFWIALPLPTNFFFGDIKTWLIENAKNLQVNNWSILWSSIFLFTLQTIWTSKNKKIFQNQSHQPEITTKIALGKAAEFWTNLDPIKKPHPITQTQHLTLEEPPFFMDKNEWWWFNIRISLGSWQMPLKCKW